jgi:HlyD family secretion protein
MKEDGRGFFILNQILKPRLLLTIAFLTLAAGVLMGCGLGQARTGTPSPTEIGPISQGRLIARADGVVQPNQTALLAWKTAGIVESVLVTAGTRVTAGQELASLAPRSLPQPVILAQVELINARRALENLQVSNIQRAQAQKALEQAEQALEDAQFPQLDQAASLEALAAARDELDNAARDYQLLATPPSQAVIDQAYASLLQAQNSLAETEETLRKLRQRLPNAPVLPFINVKDIIANAIEGLERKQLLDRRKLAQAQERYDQLLAPPDPVDLALAQARLALAQASLAQAQRELERAQAGISPADLAVLQAQADDARRAWQRLKDGPTPDDIVAAQARVAAAQAALEYASLRAPYDAVVTQVEIKTGDQVQPGSIAFRLDTLDYLLVVAQFSEIDINRLQVGQPVQVTLDSVAGRQYSGEVSEVPQVGANTGEVVTFTVKIRLLDADGRVKPGMTAKAEVTLEEELVGGVPDK